MDFNHLNYKETSLILLFDNMVLYSYLFVYVYIYLEY